MKHIRGLKPTRQQSKILHNNKMDSFDWLISKVMPDKLVCIHRESGQIKDAYLLAVRI